MVEWAGVAMTFPAEWTVSPKRRPGMLGAGASILVGFGPEGASCLLDRYDPTTVESWRDLGIEPVSELSLDGIRVERFDDMLGTGSGASTAYTLHAPDFQYSLLCSAAAPPQDRWLSIVETIELLTPAP